MAHDFSSIGMTVFMLQVLLEGSLLKFLDLRTEEQVLSTHVLVRQAAICFIRNRIFR